MVNLIVWLLLLLIVVLIVRAVLDALELPANVKKLIWLVFALLCVLAIVGRFGFSG